MTERSMSSDDYITALSATRDAIVADLEACDSMRDRAALYNRLESTLKLIHAAKPPADEKAGDPVDEVAARRAARGGATARQGRAAK